MTPRQERLLRRARKWRGQALVAKERAWQAVGPERVALEARERRVRRLELLTNMAWAEACDAR